MTSSNHPSYIFRNIPISLFKRIRRICSSYIDYLHHATILTYNLTSRGYNFKRLKKSMYQIGTIDRSKLLVYKIKESKDLSNNNLFIIKNNFDFNLLNYKELFKNSFEKLKVKYDEFTNSKIFICNSISNNISSILIHHQKINFPKHFYTKECNNKCCTICKFIYKKSFFLLGKNFYLPLQSNANCDTSNLIYLIHCNLCNLFYIGETSQSLKKRMSQHIYCIKNFYPFIKITNEVGDHFNRKNHNFQIHFKVAVFKSDIISKDDRLSIENDLIQIINRINPPVINSFIPSFLQIKKTCFQR